MIRPLNDRILVKLMDPQEVSSGGIIIPDSAKQRPIEAQVVAVGPGYTLKSGKIRPLMVEPGNRILFSKYSGDEITVKGEELLLLRENDVIAIVND